ncbi:MAG TPA: hypothetical protein VGF82_22045 [Terracidiphilus sp.]|jgi:hypothetical protein
MATKHIHTNNLENVTMNKNQEKLDITIDSSCNWCFSDPDGVFGNPSTLLPSNSYYVSGPTTYGVLTAVNVGTVYFNAVPIGTTCSPQGIQGTGHTITVSN